MSKPATSNRRDELRRQQQAEAARKRTNRIIGIGAAVVAVVLAAVFIVVLVQSQSQQQAAGTVTPPNAAADKQAIVIAKGATGAPTVTVYLDYQCPNCKHFEDAYSAMLQQEAQAGTWTLENKTLTFMDKNLSNTASARAAYAAACSDLTGKYNEYNAAVYANQAATEVRGSEGYSPTLLRETIPAQLGITGDSLAQFQQCVDGNATKAFVDGVEKSAYADGVTGTPTIAVNGKIVDLGKLAGNTPADLKNLLLASK